jgi:hypothetical protein
MFPPIFEIIAADPAVTALIGTSPTRFFLYGSAPQEVAAPYAIWQTISGRPENYLGNAPNADFVSVRVDVYAETAAQVRDLVAALRAAIQPHAYIVSFSLEGREDQTRLFRAGFDCDWIITQ